MSRKILGKPLGVMLAITVAAAFFAPDPEAQTVVGARPTVRASSSGSPSAATDPVILEIRPRKHVPELGPTFGEAAWSVPTRESAVPVSSPTAQPLSEPPALPYKLLGFYQDGSDVSAFVLDGDRSLKIHEGQMLGDNYRVDRISESDAIIVYVPMNFSHVLSVGGL